MKKIKEWFRKRMVSLKRSPNHIPLIVLCITCLIFNLKLTAYSNTIALINEPGMGFCSFVITLCSFLSVISYLTAYPKKQKPKIGSIVVVLLMLCVSIVCEFFFKYFIKYGTELKQNPIEITQARDFINVANKNCIIHIIFLSLSIVLIVTLPIYRKWIKKINTSIKVEVANIEENTETIDISEDL